MSIESDLKSKLIKVFGEYQKDTWIATDEQISSMAEQVIMELPDHVVSRLKNGDDDIFLSSSEVRWKNENAALLDTDIISARAVATWERVMPMIQARLTDLNIPFRALGTSMTIQINDLKSFCCFDKLSALI